MNHRALPALLLAVLLVPACSTAARETTHAPPATTTPPRTRPAPVEMHHPGNPHAPGSSYAATYGRGDLDGDGRPDRVVVHTDGRVVARVAGGSSSTVRLLPDQSLRLQALPDLDGDGRAEVLVAASAAGCCDAYDLPDSRSAVLVLRQGRLQQVRWASGRPAALFFDAGRGDLWAGVGCGDGSFRQVEASVGPARAQVTGVDVTIRGAVARRGRPTHSSTTADAGVAAAATRCAGMDAHGWAD